MQYPWMFSFPAQATEVCTIAEGKEPAILYLLCTSVDVVVVNTAFVNCWEIVNTVCVM